MWLSESLQKITLQFCTCSGMCEFLLRPAVVDEMTNNSLLNGDSLYFLNVVCTHLDPALLHYSFASMQRPQAILT
jgi:hypothetical protein